MDVQRPTVPGPILQNGELPPVYSSGQGLLPQPPADPYYEHAAMLIPVINGAIPIAGTEVIQLPKTEKPLVRLSQESTGIRFTFGFPSEWLGEKGDKGDIPIKGIDYFDGVKGDTGASAYQVWLLAGNAGTVQDFLNSLKGASSAAEVPIADTANNFTAINVEDALAELATSKAPVTHIHDYQPADEDLLAIGGLPADAVGLLKKIAPNTWTIDTTPYVPVASIKTTIANCVGVDNAPPSAALMAITYNGLNALLNGTSSAKNADKLDNLEAAAFALVDHNHDTAYLGINAKAADSDKLNGQLASAYSLANHNHTGTYLPAAGTAADSSKLGNQLPAYYATATHTHGPTLLFTGDFNSGEITVPNTANYTIFKLHVIGTNIDMLAIKTEDGAAVHGIGGFYSATSKEGSVHFSASISGNTWTWIGEGRVYNTPSSSHSTELVGSISKIWGIL